MAWTSAEKKEWRDEEHRRRAEDIELHFLHIARLIEETRLPDGPEEFIAGLVESLEPAFRAAPREGKKPIPQSLRREVFERDNYTCQHCTTTIDLACDHIYPESLGGEATLENLQTLCRSCNSRKGAQVA